jgi:hypothetical protein
MKRVNYLRVDPNSHHFGSIEQIITYTKCLIPDCPEKDGLINRLETSKRYGYKLTSYSLGKRIIGWFRRMK